MQVKKVKFKKFDGVDQSESNKSDDPSGAGLTRLGLAPKEMKGFELSGTIVNHRRLEVDLRNQSSIKGTA